MTGHKDRWKRTDLVADVEGPEKDVNSVLSFNLAEVQCRIARMQLEPTTLSLGKFNSAARVFQIVIVRCGGEQPCKEMMLYCQVIT